MIAATLLIVTGVLLILGGAIGLFVREHRDRRRRDMLWRRVAGED